MRYFRIFLLRFQEAFEHRSRSFVWFLISLINPLILLVYWLGYYHNNPSINSSVYTSTTTYYFLLIIVNSLLVSHIEEDIAYDDIQLGELSNHLLKPFSYPLTKFFAEIPWRITQGSFGVVVFLISYLFFRQFINISITPPILFLTVIIGFFAYILSFIFKLIMGFSAFWLVEYSGFSQLVEVMILIFAGNIMPIDFYPNFVKQIAYILPFSYIIYFPVVALAGKLNLWQLGRVIFIQILWICVLIFLYRIIWKQGVKKFTGVGN